MKNKKELQQFIYIIILVIIILLGIFSYYLLSFGFKTYDIRNVTYNEKSDIDYKVYYVKNNFFTEPYIEKDKIYISSLIDYIDVEVNYDINFDDLVSGEYVYFVNGTIVANKPNSKTENYWSKTYMLIEPKIIKYEAGNGFDLTGNIKIDYQKYNNLLKEFKGEYGLAFDGLLKITMNIQSTNNTKILQKPININSSAELSIPLTQQTINLSVNLFNVNEEKTVVERKQYIDTTDKIIISLGCILAVISLISLCLWLKKIRKFLKSQSIYNKTRRKILKTYNSIIVNIKTIPQLDGLNVIYVDNFSELIDAQNEIRMPINYIEINENKESIFFIIGNGMAWFYTLLDEEYKNSNNMKKRINKKNN